MNQTHTTNPTEGCVDQGSRAPASHHITRALSALSSRIGAVMFVLMLTGAAGVSAPAYAGEVIINESNVDQSPFNEPIDGTGRNASGGDDVADGRGGTSALKLALDETKEKATVQYLLGEVNTLDDVIALDVVSFDIYPTTYLGKALGGAALKVKCAGSTKYVEITQAEEASEWPDIYPPSGEWSTLSFDLATTPFSGKTLAEWRDASGEGPGWCQGPVNSNRVQAFEVGFGSKGQIPEEAYDVYLDYFQFGTNADTYNFELQDDTELPQVAECSDESIDWATAATEEGWSCTVDGTAYEYADFHILNATADTTDACSNLPTPDSAPFCQQTDAVVRAVFDWDNGSRENNFLSWLAGVEQIGSRTKASVPCGSADETVALRCANQLSSGKSAFRKMVGEGGAGIRNLNIDNLTSLEEMFYGARNFNEDVTGWDISQVEKLRRLFEGTKFNRDIGHWNTSSANHMGAMFLATPFNQDISGWETSQVKNFSYMFKNTTQFDQDISRWNTSNASHMVSMFENAKAFNQDLSGWNVTKVGNFSSFDQGATSWCGTDFANRGRPGGWAPSEANGCLNLTIQAPETAQGGSETEFVLQYYNESEIDFTGTLTFMVPAGMSVTDPGGGTLSGDTVTWNNLPVPGGTSADGGGGEQRVTVKIDASVSDGAELVTSATLTDGADTSVNDVATTIATAVKVVLETKEFKTPNVDGPYVLPGDLIQYRVKVRAIGGVPTQGGKLTLSWSGDVPYTIEDSGNANCSATECVLFTEIGAGGKGKGTVTVRVGAGAQSGTTLTATVVASADNAVSDSTSSITKEIDTAPSLALDMETLPTAVVGQGDEIKVVIEAANGGSQAADSTTVTLNVPDGVTFNSASDGGSESGGLISWTLSSLATNAEPTYRFASMTAPSAKDALTFTAEATTTYTTAGGASGKATAEAQQVLRVDDVPVLDLEASLSPDPVSPGGDLGAGFYLRNIGLLDASDVTLTIPVPENTRLAPEGWGGGVWSDGTDINWSCSGNPCIASEVITVDIGTLKSQSNADVWIDLLVDEPTDAQRVEIAGALTGTDGTDALLPQAASAQAQVVDGPILEVSQWSSPPDIVAPGGLLSYTIEYRNRGSSAASSVVLSDDIPVDATVAGAPGAASTDTGVAWALGELDAYADDLSEVVVLEVNGNANVGTELDNDVAITTGTQVVVAEPAPVRVGLRPLLRTDIATYPEVAAPGKPLIYEISYENAGNLISPDATLQFAVPADVTLVNDEGPACDGCTVVGNRLIWQVGPLRPTSAGERPLPGEPNREVGLRSSKQVVVTVDANVPEDTSLYAASNLATDECSDGCRSTGSDLKQAVSRLLRDQRGGAMAAGSGRTETSQRSGPLTLASTLVARTPATTIAVTATDQVIRGGQIGVEAVISTAGSATATNATVETKLPEGTQLAYLGSGGSCSADPCVAGSTLSWSLGTLVPGAERTISYALSVDANAKLGERRHVLELGSTEEGSQIGEATTSVVAGALTLDKSVTDAGGTVNPTYAEIGDVVTYTLTVDNENPSAAPDLVVTDVLPAEVIACGSCLNLSGSGASLSGNTLTWSNIDLDAREGITLSYSVTIPNVASNTTLENVANVRSTIGQSDSDSARLVITAIAELGVTLAAPAGLQPDESGSVVMTYQNTGTAATTATLSYLLPDKLLVTDSAGATVSGATYSWSLGSLAAGASGSKTLTVKAAADAPANEVLTHFVSLEGSASNLAADATDTTVIGSIEELAISVSAPSPQTTGDTFTATVVATNSGNTAANGTVVKLTLPAGFTISNAAGGTVAGQVISWNLNLPAGATQTLLPTIGTPATADTGVLNAELVAASGMTETDSTTVQVNGLTSSVIQAAIQFNVTEAKAGDSVTLTAGPVNVGGAASGAVTNAVVLEAGLTATAYDGASWNAGTRTLSWTTASLASRGSDPKSFTLQVQDAGALSAVITSNGSTGQAAIERSYPEEVTINPENSDSTCKLSGQPTVQAAPTPPSGVTLALANTVGFTVIDCDRNPNANYPETLSVTIDVGQAIDSKAKLFKIDDSNGWGVIEGAVISGQTVTYSLTDDGDLDQDKTPGTLRDPVAIAYAPELKPVLPVPIPLWLLAALMGSVGWLGYRRLRLV